jgi:hypothetical protein
MSSHDSPDWQTYINSYHSTNDLVQLGTASITTGGTAPSFLDYTLQTPNGATALFDTFYVVIEHGGSYSFDWTLSSSISQLLGSTPVTDQPIQLFGFYTPAVVGIFYQAEPQRGIPILFDNVELKAYATNITANTTYNMTLFGIKYTGISETAPTVLLANNYNGTITTANTYQQVTLTSSPQNYLLVQNQGYGRMWIDFTGAGGSTNGILLYPGGDYVSTGAANVYMANGTNVCMIKGEFAGDAFSVIYGSE